MITSRLDAALKAATETRTIPGVAAIALDRSGNHIYKGAFGVTSLQDASSARPVTSSTPFMIFSCTKLVTAVCALQLLEAGKLALDDPVENYLPEIADIKVLDSIESDGTPRLREQKSKATVRMLMTHTAGFTYDFFDKKTLAYRIHDGKQPHAYDKGDREYYSTPLVFDPGMRFKYGINSDWLGFVIEHISGMKLNKYAKKHVFDVLEMHNSGSTSSAGPFAERSFVVHIRGEDGSLTALPHVSHPDEYEIYGGGHYMYSTLDDYSKFLLTVLNGGTDLKSGAKILEKETVSKYLFEDQISSICSTNGIGVVDSSSAAFSNEGEFLPGLKKSWSCGLMLNVDANPKGRSAGSGSWCGGANSYYWIDPKEGKVGLILGGIMPFMDEECLKLFDELERAVYGHDAADGKDDVPSSFVIYH